MTQVSGPSLTRPATAMVASFQQQQLQVDLRSHVPLKAWSVDCLVFTRVSMLSFTRVYVVALIASLSGWVCPKPNTSEF